MTLAERCRGLRLILTDVDGVMTDGRVLLLPDGREAKAFHIRDGLGIVLAHRAGLRTGLLSGRASDVVARRAAELGMTVVRQSVWDKGAALREILAEQGLAAREVAYIGDDINDLPVMAEVGLTAAPADAPSSCAPRPTWSPRRGAGRGACASSSKQSSALAATGSARWRRSARRSPDMERRHARRSAVA